MPCVSRKRRHMRVPHRRTRVRGTRCKRAVWLRRSALSGRTGELGVDSGGVPHVRFQWPREGRGKEKNGPFRMSQSITFPSANTAEPLEGCPRPRGDGGGDGAVAKETLWASEQQSKQTSAGESTINSLIFLARGSGEAALSALMPRSQTLPFIAEQTLVATSRPFLPLRPLERRRRLALRF